MMCVEKDRGSAEGVTLSGVARHETAHGQNSGESHLTAEGARVISPESLRQKDGAGAVLLHARLRSRSRFLF